MAGIIAQITRANRERIEKRKFEVGVSKCMYELKPFDQCFKAEVRRQSLQYETGQIGVFWEIS